EKQSRQTLASSEAPGKGAALPVPQATDLPQGSAAENNAEQSTRTADPVRWSWRDSTGGGQVAWTAQGAFEEATKYVLSEQPRQRQALSLYQRVLDANPPRQLELHVKLTMGARMTALYDPDLGEDSLDEEAIRWYERIVQDFNDWRNHHDLMVAKIHLGELGCMGDYGITDVHKATDLCRQVIEIPENDIVFDDAELAHLNLDNIAGAKAPVGRRVDATGRLLKEPTEQMNQEYRQHLLEQRQQAIDNLRRAAVRALANMQHIPGFPPEVKLKRLLSLKQERPDDRLYQETLDAAIKRFVESHRDVTSGYEQVLDEAIDVPEVPD
ncbi:MAG: hypothetical protein JSU94_09220, partial [Phycisphaerales bacterium]